ncbi:PH domain-containing protein [Subtercola lobariae]|uniref:YdbS-like PH domain-containing protein n=1 Tax=Subtercola lobariae TaxID=1588641 RepID=A0A917B005_9MICO|nr:PH domain-containing protein [Subtercola lobariae]GGF13943.1 hypothetical protein GCM10011399_04790 [Subtercola lobariae]
MSPRRRPATSAAEPESALEPGTVLEPDDADFTTVFRGEEFDQIVSERVVARVRTSARVLFWPTILLIAVAAASGYFLGRLPEAWQNLAATALAVAMFVFLWLLPFVAWLAHRYTVTTRRVIAVRGLFVRERQEVSLRRGFDVTLRRRGLQALFRSGDVTIHSGSEHPLVMRDVPDARLIVSVLTDLSERGALERGFSS